MEDLDDEEKDQHKEIKGLDIHLMGVQARTKETDKKSTKRSKTLEALRQQSDQLDEYDKRLKDNTELIVGSLSLCFGALGIVLLIFCICAANMNRESTRVLKMGN